MAISLALPQMMAGLLALTAPEAGPTPTASVHLYAVRGEVDMSLMQDNCRAIEASFDLACSVHLAPASSRWRPESPRIDAAAFLESRFEHSVQGLRGRKDLRAPGSIDLWLTSRDLYEGRRRFVFGITSITDRIGVVSTFRLVDPLSKQRTHARVHKVVIHELAHALGLGHHDDNECAMQIEPDLAHLDEGSQTLCGQCQRKAELALTRLSRQGQLVWDRARGHKARGAHHLARPWLVRLAKSKLVDPILKLRAHAMFEQLTQARR